MSSCGNQELEPYVPRSTRTTVGKQELAQRALELTSVEFIRKSICPMLGAVVPEQEWKTEVEQNTGTGRLTLRYELGPETILHAKLFTDDLGLRSYTVQKALWEAGFNHRSRYQVPEPIGFLSGQNVLVMRHVTGTPLAAAVDEADASIDLLEGCQQAAGWLAALHRSSLRVGTVQTDWEALKLFRVSARLIKAVAERPEHVEMVRDLLDEVTDGIQRLPARRPTVQTHGRYHHDHIFLSPGMVAVIDLDRCCPSDPGKDVAEFVRVLRSSAFKQGSGQLRIEQATNRFLEAYLKEVPEAALSLRCYWSTFTFHSLLGWLKKSKHKDKTGWQELTDFYQREIKKALEMGV